MPKTASLFLRIGLAGAFAYATVSSFLYPEIWAGFIPLWITNIVPASVLLPIHATVEGILALWLLSGKYTYWAALLAVVMLTAVVIANIQAYDIVFRDIALIFAALGLAALHKESKTIA